MDVALLLARLLLASVFMVAGAAKLADREGSRRALADFGVPPRWRVRWRCCCRWPNWRWRPPSYRPPPPGGAPRGHSCSCSYSSLRSPPIWPAAARQSAIASGSCTRNPQAGRRLRATVSWPLWPASSSGGATMALAPARWVGSRALGAQVAGLVVGLAVLGVLAAQSLLLLNLIKQNGRLLMRVDALESGQGGGAATLPHGSVATQPSLGLPIGDTAPEFELPGLHGETLTLESLRASGKPVMLLFTDTNCASCTAMLPEIRRWQKSTPRS